jgi:alkylation response protein AidB-like acyl-CoA dehydrogenase
VRRRDAGGLKVCCWTVCLHNTRLGMLHPEAVTRNAFGSRLRFEGVEVDADAVIGEVDGGRAPLARVLNAVRVGSASELIGVGAGAMALTVNYLSTRKQFGQPIGAFQALQRRVAHLYSGMEVARSATPSRSSFSMPATPRRSAPSTSPRLWWALRRRSRFRKARRCMAASA